MRPTGERHNVSVEPGVCEVRFERRVELAFGAFTHALARLLGGLPSHVLRAASWAVSLSDELAATTPERDWHRH